MIKQKLFIALVAVGALGFVNTAKAQKIGYINPYDVFSRLPETKLADSAMNLFRQQLDKENLSLQAELEMLSKKFNADSAKMTAVQKEIARKDLQPVYMKVINFNSDAQKRLEAKQQELAAPIQQRTMEIIKAVATENGYTHVLSRDVVLIAPPGDDLYPLIKKKYNLQD